MQLVNVKGQVRDCVGPRRLVPVCLGKDARQSLNFWQAMTPGWTVLQISIIHVQNKDHTGFSSFELR